jgi:glycerol-3-phosphate dehydrogenase (NAD(P)+)
MNTFPGTIAVLGGGSWATALAKIVLSTQDHLNWYIRRPELIARFREVGHNPAYMTAVNFDLSRISFFSDINKVIRHSDTILLAIPSPYLIKHLNKIRLPLHSKYFLSAIKGIVPIANIPVSQYLASHFAIPHENIAIISGPCHAEEIALERLSCLTIASADPARAQSFASVFSNHYLQNSFSSDVIGIEYASVLKNVYSIMSGICHGLNYGDNFQALFITNAIKEMRRFIDTLHPTSRDITDSAYLGDLLVTAYSGFSRNHTFGTMIGRGYSVKGAQTEMKMIAEGYFGTKCIFEINQSHLVHMPILDALHAILYNNVVPASLIHKLARSFT